MDTHFCCNSRKRSRPFSNRTRARVTTTTRDSGLLSASDIFLGWSRGRAGKNFYVRQLRDMKFSAPLEGVTASMLERYAGLCGWSLARAHARSGDAATIAGYLGSGDKFDLALGDFAVAYADQTEEDHTALKKAVDSGRIEALIEENL